jgi:hypothetical protein
MECIPRIALVVATTALLFGCGGAGGGPMVGNPDDPTCSTASDSSESIGFKAPPGYTASMDLFSNNDCFAPAGYSTHAQSSVIGGPPFADPSSPRDRRSRYGSTSAISSTRRSFSTACPTCTSASPT